MPRKQFRIFLIVLVFVTSIHAFADCSAILRHFSPWPISNTGMDIETVIKSAKLKTVPLPGKNGIETFDLIVLDDVFSPDAYSGSYNLLTVATKLVHSAKKILILGSGSGYESTGIALLGVDSQIDAIDISRRSIINTELNAEFYHLCNVKSWQSDLFTNVVDKYDFIVFHAPRATSPIPNERVCDTKFFDLDGKIRKQFLFEAQNHLTYRGQILFLTESDFLSPTEYESQVMMTAPWSKTNNQEGNYSIFLLTTK